MHSQFLKLSKKKKNKDRFVLSISLFSFMYVLGKRRTLQDIKIAMMECELDV